MPAQTAPSSTEGLAQIFTYFAEQECRGYSPLYERLCAGIAGDPELLELAAAARRFPVPNVLLAAVHFLLLGQPRQPLAAFYPSVSGKTPPVGDPYPLFRDFCLNNDQSLRRLLATRLTQTNEVARCACLLPAFGIVAADAGGLPMAMVEVGASAGLNLLWDRFGYQYNGGPTYGDPTSPVQVQCEWRGDGPPLVPDPFPRVVYRLGIDLNPINLNDSDEALWLRSLIWPEHADRFELLAGAITLARRRPPSILRGDALEHLPDVLAAAPVDATLCVFHSFTVNQFSADDRHYFSEILHDESHHRPVYRISFEGEQPRTATIRLRTYVNGERTNRELALCQPHGKWIEWRG